MKKRVGVVLSGCGFLDGAEIHESVLTLLHLDRAGAEVVCFAPDREQLHVVDHRTGQPAAGESRNVLTESARIARGKIADLAAADAEQLDAVVLPGGFGAAKNLSDFASAGADATVDPDLRRLLLAMHAGGKPIGVVCIAPAVCAAAFRDTDSHPALTVGEDPGTAAAIEATGSRHENRPVTEICVDEDQRVVSTPAYMFDARIADVSTGIEQLVQKVLSLA
jgi:enhancing lycopene biosynthesis protein 2